MFIKKKKIFTKVNSEQFTFIKYEITFKTDRTIDFLTKLSLFFKKKSLTK